MRSFLVCVVFMLAVLGGVSAAASSSEWSAPEALWSSELSASELEARHAEFLMAVDASSSSGAFNESSSSSSSSTGVSLPVVPIAPCEMELACSVASNATNPCPFTEESIAASVQDAFNFPDPNLPGERLNTTFTPTAGSASSTGAAAAESSTGAAAAPSSSTGSVVVGRRLLQTSGGTKAVFDFIGSPVDGGAHARLSYAALVESLKCISNECRDTVATKFGFPTGKLSANPTFTALAATVVPGSLVVDDAAVAAANSGVSGEREVPTVGGPRDTNIGYYVLGAILLAFIVAALIYMIVHKKPVAAVTKEEPRRDEVALAPVVAAPVAGSGVVVAEEQPLAAAGQQQMDYRSVFALKHNVLDKSAEQKAAEEDEHNHNDVHFILHQ